MYLKYLNVPKVPNLPIVAPNSGAPVIPRANCTVPQYQQLPPYKIFETLKTIEQRSIHRNSTISLPLLHCQTLTSTVGAGEHRSDFANLIHGMQCQQSSCAAL